MSHKANATIVGLVALGLALLPGTAQAGRDDRIGVDHTIFGTVIIATSGAMDGGFEGAGGFSLQLKAHVFCDTSGDGSCDAGDTKTYTYTLQPSGMPSGGRMDDFTVNTGGPWLLGASANDDVLDTSDFGYIVGTDPNLTTILEAFSGVGANVWGTGYCADISAAVFTTTCAAAGNPNAIGGTTSWNLDLTPLDGTDNLNNDDRITIYIRSTAFPGIVGFSGSDTAPGTSGDTLAPIPEPGSLLLLGSGLLAVGSFARRRRIGV